MSEFLTASSILSIDLDALAENYNIYKSKISPDCCIAGVVKANAYGLGLEAVVGRLAAEKCPQFFVATVEEALNFRKFNASSPIAVLGGLFMGTEDVYVAQNITPVLNSPDDIAHWKKMAVDNHQKLPAFIHFDTGMNRLGLSAAETESLLNDPILLEGIDVQMIMSHFVAADDWAIAEHKNLTKMQADKFSKIATHFPKAKKSLANSSGVFCDTAYHYDMVRPGYAMYGGNPTPHTTNPMKPVVSLHTRILQIRHCKKGESIGYSATHKFEKDTLTATVALGYADGFLRSNSSRATLYYKGQACPVLGRVSMDLVTLDLSGIKQSSPAQGDAIEVLGVNQTIDDLAAAAGTIGYEILTSLGARYRKEYKGVDF